MHLLRQHIEKIVPLTDSEFDYVLSHFSTRKFRKHQFLVQEGDLVPQEFFVIKGCMKSYMMNEEDKEYILQFAMESWWISDFEAYNKHTPATLNVNCIEDSEVLCLSYENREKMCDEMHKMEHYFRKISHSGYIALQQRILCLLSSTAKERYDKLRNQYPTLFQRVPKSVIAAYLGVSRETLSRMV
ncbi:cAMP-binding domain of CRP or a regulatory subunit of cAMP-dependent protein kinases [Chitinophaga sp. YR573]|uniref:Crp/Fnr family transcriptional regulator n=1 Tax=Chitinophaga sp. YR573 TaxID=1881040 RepID=UPI0008D5673D|nr:Crp/Fnr family transcriptional regulator [Chitinophaga sp. YR573]SEW20720.1 cAMP-binding domain of CRP or a regulatory subunit of cAMP-dependent protein kinases [Chitinophaga sp. YR573]